MRLTCYDIHLLLSCICNEIENINKYDKKDLRVENDYRYLYFQLRKFLMNGGNLDV